MGVHPREVLKQLMQMNGEEGEDDGYGEEEPVHEEEEDEAEKEERLRQEKALFKQQMMMAQKPAKVAPEPLAPPTVDSYDDDQSSYYSEGEIQTRIKLIGQKSYSAPYIIFSDCYEEALGGSEDDESQRPPSKAYSESILQQLELQEQPAPKQAPLKPEAEEEELDVDISQRLLELQNKSSGKRQKP